MSKGVVIAIVLFIVLVVAAVITVVIYEERKKSDGKSQTSTQNLSEPSEPSEVLEEGNEFYIYNYTTKSICIKGMVDIRGMKRVDTLVSDIHPSSKRGFTLSSVEKYLRSGSMFKIYTFDTFAPGLGKKLFAEYEIDTPEDTTIRALHVGMVTSRWVGADADYNIGKPGNAVQGLPWIKIHNRTQYPLSINNNINISPGGTLRYTGRDHRGVRLGTVFEDQDRIFKNFIFTIPATDIYYGVVSDIQQPLFGGWQMTPEFNDDPNEPQYLLEEGFMGGPGYPRMPYGLVPREGPEVPPQDRWGRPITEEFEINHPVGPPVELNAFQTSSYKH